MEIFLLLFVLVQLLVVMTEGKRVDIQREIRQIVRHHNTERRSENLKAPYMMQLAWDARLAAEAQRWADKCEYRRPNSYEASVGSNLYYKLNYAQDRHAVHTMVGTAMRTWMRGKNEYRTDEPCRRTCGYAQMVHYKSDQIGCAINTCRSIQVGSRRESFSTMLVCFYSPRMDIRNARPYQGLPSCSRCPRSTVCKQGLCSNPNSDPVPIYVPEPAPTAAPSTRVFADSMSTSETQYVLSAHNRLREGSQLDTLEWDGYLERWAKWVVSCKADYPGPKHCYTNFARLKQSDQVYRLIYRWESEGDDINVIFQHGCRTPMDLESCNHNTNIKRPQLTSMACASKACDDDTRQMVCIYDNRVDRVYTRSAAESSPYNQRSRVSEAFRGTRRRNGNGDRNRRYYNRESRRYRDRSQ